MSRRLLRQAALLAAAITLGLGARAEAAAPPEFHGIVGTGTPTPAQMQRMAQGGAKSVRSFFYWNFAEPSKGQRDWSYFDYVMTGAAKAGITVLPVLYGSAPWVSAANRPPIYSAEARAGWSAFVTELAARYGAGGSFWAAHPELVARPLQDYQVWNEVNLRFYWGGRPSARGYAKLVRLTGDALRAADPSANVVLAGLIPFKSVGAGSVPGSAYLRRLFRLKGFRGEADAVALHPYGKSPRVVLKALQTTRKTLNQIGGRRIPLWVTEFGWSTGGLQWGRSPVRATSAQQARWVSQTYARMEKGARRLKLRRAFYFTFSDVDPSGPDYWNARMGLFDLAGQPKPAWFAYTRSAGGTP